MNTEQQGDTHHSAGESATRLGPPTADTGTTPFLSAHREVLRQALADAISYRDPPLLCPDCEALARLCSQCIAGLCQARAYLALSRELQISPAGPDGHADGPAHPTIQNWIPGDS
jgi:hypothetical protein